VSDASEPGVGPRGLGESSDAPAPDVPPVEELPPGRLPIGESPAEARPLPPRVVRPERVLAEVVPVDDLRPPSATLRRAPRYRAFIGTGVVIGAVLGVVLTVAVPGVVLTVAVPDNGRFSTGAVLGYLAVSLGLLGGLLGAAAAVVADRRR
jgi:hypothetical protein